MINQCKFNDIKWNLKLIFEIDDNFKIMLWHYDKVYENSKKLINNDNNNNILLLLLLL